MNAARQQFFQEKDKRVQNNGGGGSNASMTMMNNNPNNNPDFRHQTRQNRITHTQDLDDFAMQNSSSSPEDEHQGLQLKEKLGLTPQKMADARQKRAVALNSKIFVQGLQSEIDSKILQAEQEKRESESFHNAKLNKLRADKRRATELEGATDFLTHMCNDKLDAGDVIDHVRLSGKKRRSSSINPHAHGADQSATPGGTTTTAGASNNGGPNGAFGGGGLFGNNVTVPFAGAVHPQVLLQPKNHVFGTWKYAVCPESTTSSTHLCGLSTYTLQLSWRASYIVAIYRKKMKKKQLELVSFT
ncbi:unnamed protein product, partial [Amoebophrya sp. A120]|eukprot:GSA120T00003194001.1